MPKSIFQAAQEDDIPALNFILENHPRLASCIDEATGWTPLHFASKSNAVKAAELFASKRS